MVETMKSKMVVGLEPLAQSLEKVGVVVTVVGCVIPPPGGQIISTVIGITTLVLKGALTVRVCKKLACRCNHLVSVAFPNEKALQHVPPKLHQCLLDLDAVCTKVKKFVEGVKEKGWLMRILLSGPISEQLKQLDTDLSEVLQALQLCYSTEQFISTQTIKEDISSMNDVFQELKRDAEKVENVIRKYGGNEAVCSNTKALQEVAEVIGGHDAVMMHMLSEIKALMQARAADEYQGFHQIINHPQLRSLWCHNFRGADSVTWEEFFAKFPSHLMGMEAAEIEELADELRQGEGRSQLRRACDVNRDNRLSVAELSDAFPPDTRIIDTMREIKACRVGQKGNHLDLPLLPAPLFGRQRDLEALVSKLTPLGKERVVVVSGGPGVGKVTVAAAALRRLYDTDQAAGGVWRCSMAGVTSHKDMMMRFLTRLSRSVVVIDQVGGEEAALRTIMMKLNQRMEPLYLLVDDCEDITLGKAASIVDADLDPHTLLSSRFEHQLVQLLQQVSRLKIVLVTRNKFSFRGLKGELQRLGSDIYEHDVGPLSLADATDMVRTCCQGVNQEDAKAIAGAVNANPLMLGIVCDALLDGRMTVKQVLEGRGLRLEGDGKMEQALLQVHLTVRRTLNTLSPDQRTLLLKMGLLLPGPFSLTSIEPLLDLPFPKIPSSWMGVFQRCRLLEVSGREGAEEYRVTSMLRETAHNWSLQCRSLPPCQLTPLLSPESMALMWHKYILYCRDMVQRDLQHYRTWPVEGYKQIVCNRPWVHQVLHLIIDHHNDHCLLQTSLPPFLGLLLHLPYLAKVHDDELVMEACSALERMTAKDTAMSPVAKRRAHGLCLAVKAHFMPAMNNQQMEDIIPVVWQVHELLDGLGDPESQLVHALGLRRKGVVLRDMGHHDESRTALVTARTRLDAPTAVVYPLPQELSLGQTDTQELCDMRMLELILDLTELAGTLDYMGRVDEGQPIASQALDCSYALYGLDTKHPVTALCLTTLGYYHKARGLKCEESIQQALRELGQGREEMLEEIRRLEEHRCMHHDQALKCHTQALEIRKATLGEDHLEVSLSLQQAALSQQALNKFPDANASLRRSLSIRQLSLGPSHFLVTSTHKALADHYLMRGMQKTALTHLEARVEIGEKVWGQQGNRVHEKLQAAARDLAQVHRDIGELDKAVSIERKYIM